MADQMTIDFGKIHGTAIRGINRAAVFLGLGVNAADQSASVDYHLTSDTNLRMLPDVDDEVLGEWKKEFRVWIVGCGFREMIDGICVYLDRLHVACRMIDRSSSEKILKEFEFFGLVEKLDSLEKVFGISCRFNEQLASFYPVRNCFVHRLGRVGDQDLRKADQLKLRFMRYDSVFVTSSGEELRIPDIFDPNSPQFVTPEAGSLGIKWVEKSLSFSKGDWVVLSPKDLTEILFFTSRCVMELTKTTLRFAKARGVTFDANAEQVAGAD